MASKIPPGLKPVKTFLLRAKELDRAKVPKADVMAYCCRRYALQKALASAEIKAAEGCAEYLGLLMDTLEQTKPLLEEKYGEELMADKAVQLALVKQFGATIFQNASGVYKSGSATKKTAVSFHAAAAYLEVAGPEDPDLIQARKTAKFNAMEIMKALKEGRTPMPPATEEEEEVVVQEEEQEDELPAQPAPAKSFDGDYGFADALPAVVPDANLKPLGPPITHAAAPVVPTYEPEPVVPAYQPAPVTSYQPAEPMSFSQSSGDHVTTKALSHCQLAVKALKVYKYDSVVKETINALAAIEGRKRRAFSAKALDSIKTSDVTEYLMFSIRTLETAGSSMPIHEAKNRAVQLLSEALRVMQS